MAQITIKNRLTGAVLYTHEATDERQQSGLAMRDALEMAAKAGTNLTDAYLTGAILADATLTGAILADATLVGANLAGAMYRGVKISRAPLCIDGLRWRITVLGAHMQIGCEFHSLAEWAAFDDARIAAMDGRNALLFWRAHKAAILALAASDGRIVATDEMEVA